MDLDQFSILQVIILACLEEDTKVDREVEETAEVELLVHEDLLMVETAGSHTQMIQTTQDRILLEAQEDHQTTFKVSRAIILSEATAIKSIARKLM